MSEPAEDYSPEQITYWLTHWKELQIAAEGATGSLNGQGGGRRKRMDTVILLADLEAAADQLPQHWSGTMSVFQAQGRLKLWRDRRLFLEDISVDQAIQRMARQLGWGR